MSKTKKIIISVISAILVVAVAVGALIIFLSPKGQIEGSLEMLPPEETVYSTDDSGERLADIPYSDYVGVCSVPKSVRVVEGLKPVNNYESNTELIQAAIDGLKEKGGTVCIPAGEYYIKSIVLYDNITLFIDKDCTLCSVSNFEYSISDNKCSAVISAEKAKNVCVTGGGTIVGFGETFVGEAERTEPFYALKEFNLFTRVAEASKRLRRAEEGTARPDLLSFKNCENVKIDSLIIKDPALRALSFESCSDVNILNVVIDGGLFVDGAEGVAFNGIEAAVIDHCFIASAGDGISVKSSLKKAVDVKISDCEICSFSNCFRIGDETNYNVQNVTLADCFFFVPDGLLGAFCGIAIESADGSKISNVEINNVEMNGVSSPLLIWLGDRLERKKTEVGSVHDIKISGITASNIELPCAITGCSSKNVYNIELTDFSLSYRESGENLEIASPSEESGMSGFPQITRVSSVLRKDDEKTLYYSLPCCGLFLRYAESIDISDFACAPRSSTKLEMIGEENVSGIKVN